MMRTVLQRKIRDSKKGVCVRVCVCVCVRVHACMFSHSFMSDSLQPHGP